MSANHLDIFEVILKPFIHIIFSFKGNSLSEIIDFGRVFDPHIGLGLRVRSIIIIY